MTLRTISMRRGVLLGLGLLVGGAVLLGGCLPWLVLVPDVVELVRAKAEVCLAGAGLLTGAVSRELSDTVPAGSVLAQNPPACQIVPRNSEVQLTVSLGPGCEDDAEAPLPELRPLSAEQAAALGAYCRKLQVVWEDSDPTPIAWSMANTSCQDRALVLQYAIASASFPLPETPPVMHDTDITEEAILALAANPGIDAATINIAGPLITAQTWIDPEGTPVAGDPQRPYWPYHHAVVLNVEGELRVMDLSIQDAPLPIAEWVRGFVIDDFPCALMTEADYQPVWNYWSAAMSNWEPEARPLCPCAYTITPLFRFRWDQDPLVEAIWFATEVMISQTGGFLTIMEWDYGLFPALEDVPGYTSEYVPLNEVDLCEWVDLLYCH